MKNPYQNANPDKPQDNFEMSVGFASSAIEFADPPIDLTSIYVKNPAATFYARVKGNSLTSACIGDGDLLIIDKSLTPANGKIAVCFIEGEFTARKIKVIKGTMWLVADNENLKPVKIDETEHVFWGVVSYVIKAL